MDELGRRYLPSCSFHLLHFSLLLHRRRRLPFSTIFAGKFSHLPLGRPSSSSFHYHHETRIQSLPPTPMCFYLSIHKGSEMWGSIVLNSGVLEDILHSLGENNIFRGEARPHCIYTALLFLRLWEPPPTAHMICYIFGGGWGTLWHLPSSLLNRTFLKISSKSINSFTSKLENWNKIKTSFAIYFIPNIL